MSFEVFMQVWCLQKSKLWWSTQGKPKTGENRGEKPSTTPFWQLLGPFWLLPEVHFLHTIYRFEAQEVKSPTLQTVSKSKLKRKSYGHYKKTVPSWKKISHRANQGANQGVKIFAPCKTLSWHMSAISHTSSPFLHRAKQGAKISHTTIQGAKFIPTCEFECENFATVGHNFEALPGAQIMHTICRFESWEVRNPEL